MFFILLAFFVCAIFKRIPSSILEASIPTFTSISFTSSILFAACKAFRTVAPCSVFNKTLSHDNALIHSGLNFPNPVTLSSHHISLVA
jgi:hypothetical protein